MEIIEILKLLTGKIISLVLILFFIFVVILLFVTLIVKYIRTSKQLKQIQNKPQRLDYEILEINELEEIEKIPETKELLPYKKNRFLLTRAENNFYKVLKLALEDNYVICPKVRLADIIYVYGSDNRQSYFNKIQSKHIDFLICNDIYLNPLLAIELDDSSHSSKYRIERDEFLDDALESADLPILRFRASYSYSPNYIKEKIQEVLKKEKVS
ncbi:DUF2726 domain-containing protein [Paramaledivibacter caminithermalis]|jgi:hypothetical protein|uniref:DUF2726 domain-containing protein n=1 Tax=Paramaledivibacter caminithermalis (strain DSM 15212 / CIP 107654 / DViRD3) TaxID=1121301 RepID=A0A1M6K4V8_PARC5|nr:DUF2726 domain-containing protein [Paramaledivibacter caminithermalis]SHJ53994.1 Protein of unknown function [Paramaledivibacter caminithermalis DSM 15212]